MRLNGVSPYYTMFPLSFPYEHLREARSDDWVLDPFCGRGTTNYAARLRGLSSVGIDVDPVATATAAAKLEWSNVGDVVSLAGRILTAKRPVEMPTGRFWEVAYGPKTLEGLCRLREYFQGPVVGAESTLLRAIVLGILHGPRLRGLPTYLSNQMPRTYATKPDAAIRFWERMGLEPLEVDVLDAIERRARYVLEMPPPSVDGSIIKGDSRVLSRLVGRRRFRWIITSPPYYGMRTYGADQWLRRWLLGGRAHVDYSSTDQIPQSSPAAFAAALASVWVEASRVATDDAALVIRIGGLPSVKSDHEATVRRSIDLTEGLWKIDTIIDAGHANEGKRQAVQFPITSEPIREIDVLAVRGTPLNV